MEFLHASFGKKRKRSQEQDEDLGVVVVPPYLTHPRSLYEGHPQESPACSEAKALDVLLDEFDLLQLGEDYAILDLEEFEIFRSRDSKHAQILTSLNDLRTRNGVSDLYFDGVLSFQGRQCRVEAIPFSVLAIDGYHEVEEVSVVDKVCIRSRLAERRLVWYRLGRPSSQYRRFHEPFLWLVDFARYFVNFLEAEENVCLRDFRSKHYSYLHSIYGHSEVFRHWLEKCGRTDFRIDITAHFEFLWKEAIDINEENRRHKVWQEVDSKQLRAVRQETNEEKSTIVTPYVYHCFRNMYFAKCLEPRSPVPKVSKRHKQRVQDLGFADEGLRALDIEHDLEPDSDFTSARIPLEVVRVGDIIGIPRDADTRWKDNHCTWYAYVQAISFDKHKRKLLRVIWLYRPSDTTCSYMTYPHSNELFLSDNCNCGDGRFFATDVSHKLRARLFPKRVTKFNEVFIRQTYLTGDGCFVTLRPEHLRCSHLATHTESAMESIKQKYAVGDTVLVRFHRSDFLEPCRIARIDDDFVIVQQLMRRARDLLESGARAHEVVFSKKLRSCAPKSIIRRCNVRVSTVEEARSKTSPPPAPYNYDGAADCWLLTGEISELGKLEPVSNNTANEINEGFDPCFPKLEPLAGLSLFSGGGSFDRGLEEGGMVDFKVAVDWDESAMHTYLANLKVPGKTCLFFGSVNDSFAKALAGSKSSNVPQVGTIQVIVGGSPCQGVSVLQPDSQSAESLRNTSLVASLVAYIDLYRPEYALFENVYGLTRSMSKHGNENVFSQIICAVVGMGYQVQPFNIDAWSHGPSQSRSRLFLAIIAPGLTPLEQPPQTHAHPSGTKARSLGVTANGLSFGNRRNDYTPFDFTTAEAATRDLPWIGDGIITSNIACPDHRPSAYKVGIRSVIPKLIPRYPSGCGWATALAEGRIPQELIDDVCGSRAKNKKFMSDNNKAYTRVNQNHVFPTITTTVKPDDARSGQWLHWDQHRLITLMEARRAQGIPDQEVLIGVPSKQWKLTGNGVARQVAVALGMSLREACLNNKAPYVPPAEIHIGREQNTPSNSVQDLSSLMLLQTLHRNIPTTGVIGIDSSTEDSDKDESSRATMQRTSPTTHLTPITPPTRASSYGELGSPQSPLHDLVTQTQRSATEWSDDELRNNAIVHELASDSEDSDVIVIQRLPSISL